MLFVNKYFIWALPYLTQLAVLVQNRNSSRDANVFLVICLGDRGLVQQQKEDERAGKGSLSCLLLISTPCLPTKRGLQPITQPPICTMRCLELVCVFYTLLVEGSGRCHHEERRRPSRLGPCPPPPLWTIAPLLSSQNAVAYDFIPKVFDFAA